MAESACYDDMDDELSKSCSSRDDLKKVWIKLLKSSKKWEIGRVSCFFHCTSVSNKKEILKSGIMKGNCTQSPELAPLAASTSLKGVWFVLALEGKGLPRKSPYGTQRMKMPVSVLMNYIENASMENDEENHNDDEEEDLQVPQAKLSFYEKRRLKRKTAKANKGKPEKAVLRHSTSYFKEDLFLFFESSYTYCRKTWYIRLVLIRSTDTNLPWCEQNLYKVDIHSNPFFQLADGKLFSARNNESEFWIEVLIVGDIAIDKLREKPDWDTVGKGRREGREPEML